MSDMIKILWKMDPDIIGWQYCAICGSQKLRIISEPERPDFALCDSCRSAFIMEDGKDKRLLYGHIPATMPQARRFALKQWRSYQKISTLARGERRNQTDKLMPPDAQDFTNNQDAFLGTKSWQSSQKPPSPRKDPPRMLKETGELPNLDDLFNDPD